MQPHRLQFDIVAFSTLNNGLKAVLETQSVLGKSLLMARA